MCPLDNISFLQPLLLTKVKIWCIISGYVKYDDKGLMHLVKYSIMTA